MKMLQKENSSRVLSVLVVVICLLGLFLRAYFYLVNRSLWLDEAMLALNLVNRSFLNLFKPLDYDQGAPIGFLLLQKAVVYLLGSRDYTLRLIPLLAGIISVPLMYAVSTQYGQGLAPVVSLGLFAFSAKLISYSSELKQYSTDVLVILILLFIVPKCIEGNKKLNAIVVLGIAGTVGVWISHPSVFLFIGILVTLGVTFLLRKESHLLLWLVGVAIVWVVNLIFIYLISLRYLALNSELIDYWSGSFAPLPPWSDFHWYYKALGGLLYEPAGLPTTVLTVGLLIIGVFSITFRRWQFSMVMVTPFLLTLIASAFEKYPFSGRLLLFTMPLLLLILAEGVERIRLILLNLNRPIAHLIFTISVAYLLYNPIIVAYNNLQSPPMGEHIKPVMAYLKEKHQKPDLIYVYYGAQPAFEFYSPLYGFDPDAYSVGQIYRDEPAKYLQDIDSLRGYQRVWFVFAHNCNWCVVDEEKFILEHLNKIGIKSDEFLSSGVSAYLYSLTQSQ